MQKEERIKELESLIERNITLYYSDSNKAVSNTEFDSWVEELEQLAPNSPVLEKMEDSLGDYEKVHLPFRLYSQKKVKIWKDIENWFFELKKKLELTDEQLKNTKFIITPKYDGIQLETYKDKKYTRGTDGIEGFDVTPRANKFGITNQEFTENYAFGGELICSNENFEYFENLGYLSPRNLIQSFFTNKEVPKGMNKIDYLRYSVYNNSLDKYEQLNLCNKVNKVQVPFWICSLEDLNESLLDELFENYSKKYKIDGLVIDINNVEYREKLGYQNKYPSFSRAFKPERYNQELKKTKIKNIRLQISRYGKIAPVAEVEPVLINEGIVKNVSLYNINYLYAQKISIGQEGYIYRSGSINPKFQSFIENENLDLYKVLNCPCCNTELKWDDNHIDLICPNHNGCQEQLIQRCYFFFKKIGLKDFGLESVRGYIEQAKFTHLVDFFDKDKIQNSIVEGIGQKSKDSFIEKVTNLIEKGVKLEVLQEASGVFEGIAESSLKLLNTVSLDMEYLYNDSYYNQKREELLALDGIGEITAEEFLYQIQTYWRFYKEYLYFLPIIKQNKTNNLEHIKVVFTGFRDEILKSYVEDRGGKVFSTTTETCLYLVTKDTTSTTSKIEKARKLNIEILSIEDFKKIINFNE